MLAGEVEVNFRKDREGEKLHLSDSAHTEAVAAVQAGSAVRNPRFPQDVTLIDLLREALRCHQRDLEEVAELRRQLALSSEGQRGVGGLQAAAAVNPLGGEAPLPLRVGPQPPSVIPPQWPDDPGRLQNPRGRPSEAPCAPIPEDDELPSPAMEAPEANGVHANGVQAKGVEAHDLMSGGSVASAMGQASNASTPRQNETTPPPSRNNSQVSLLKKQSQTAKPSTGGIAALMSTASDTDPRTDLEKFVDGPFDKFSALVISLNIFCMFFNLQYEGYKAGARQDFDKQGQWPNLDEFWSVVEHIFNIIFLGELLFRLTVMKVRFWFHTDGSCDKFNTFDFVLVMASSIDLYIIQPVAGSSGMNLSIFRPFRFLRLVRALRVLQSVKFLMSLRVLVNSVIASFLALFWSITLLWMVMLMTALFLCQTLTSAVEDPSINHETRSWIYVMYGTASRSLYTVFELTFSGCWPNYARPLVEEVNSLFTLFFIIYIIAVTFAMFRIITALFLRDTLALAASDAELAVQAKMKEKQKYAQQLLSFFEAADTSGDGTLTKDEFEAVLAEPKVKTWLSLMDLDVHETSEFFHLLAGVDGTVSGPEFVQGILRLKGQARAQDVVAIRYANQRLLADVELIEKTVSEIKEEMCLHKVSP